MTTEEIKSYLTEQNDSDPESLEVNIVFQTED
jgi:hypothetical protein